MNCHAAVGDWQWNCEYCKIAYKAGNRCRKTWSLPGCHSRPRISCGYLWLSSGYPPAIFGNLGDFFRLSSAILRLSSGYLPAIFDFPGLSCGYLAAIFRLSSVFLGFLPAISWLSSCLISFLPFKSIKHYNGMNMFLLSTFDPAGKLRRANKSSKQKQV